VGLISLILGYFLTPYVDTVFLTIIFFTFFTIIHLFSNYMAVTSLVMEKLNRQRGNLVIDWYLQTFDTIRGIGHVLSPKNVCKREKIIYFDPHNVVIGESIENFTLIQSTRLLSEQLKSKRKYILLHSEKLTEISLRNDISERAIFFCISPW